MAAVGSSSLFPYIRSLLPQPFDQLALTSAKVITKKREESAVEIKNSCIATFIALSVIFSGSHGAKSLFARVKLTTAVTLNINYGNQGKCYEYQLVDLLSGHLQYDQPLSVSQDNPLSPQKLFEMHVARYAQDFLDYMAPYVAHCSQNEKTVGELSETQIIENIEKLLTNIDYSFNLNAITSLKVRTLINSDHLGLNTSFVYYITILRTDKNFFHALVIEQFYDPNHPYGLYRIYQSCIKAFTLDEYLDQKNECLNHQEIQQFLKDIHTLLCNRNGKTAEALEEISTLSKKCFHADWPIDGHPPLFYDPKKRVLGGLSLRYQWDRIDPTKCRQNYESFMAESV